MKLRTSAFDDCSSTITCALAHVSTRSFTRPRVVIMVAFSHCHRPSAVPAKTEAKSRVIRVASISNKNALPTAAALAAGLLVVQPVAAAPTIPANDYQTELLSIIKQRTGDASLPVPLSPPYMVRLAAWAAFAVQSDSWQTSRSLRLTCCSHADADVQLWDFICPK
jgi:hypothetical protein